MRNKKIKKSEILDFTVDELEVLFRVSKARANKIYELAEFQCIPSIGIKLAKDLVFWANIELTNYS